MVVVVVVTPFLYYLSKSQISCCRSVQGFYVQSVYWYSLRYCPSLAVLASWLEHVLLVGVEPLAVARALGLLAPASERGIA